MKTDLEKAILHMPMTGACTLDVLEVVKHFDGSCFISRYNDEYRLIQAAEEVAAQIKITIKKEDALAIIKEKKLVEQKSEIFQNASSYKKK